MHLSVIICVTHCHYIFLIITILYGTWARHIREACSYKSLLQGGMRNRHDMSDISLKRHFVPG